MINRQEGDDHRPHVQQLEVSSGQEVIHDDAAQSFTESNFSFKQFKTESQVKTCMELKVCLMTTPDKEGTEIQFVKYVQNIILKCSKNELT